MDNIIGDIAMRQPPIRHRNGGVTDRNDLSVHPGRTVTPVYFRCHQIAPNSVVEIYLLGCEEHDILLASAKEGIGIQEILENIVVRIPAPTGDTNAPLKALVFDSMFNSYRGTIVYFRVLDGRIRKGDHVIAEPAPEQHHKHTAKEA